jgi:hypothetical protein
MKMNTTTVCGTNVKVEYKTSVCGKCNGERFFHCYDHIARGVCFACKGTGEIRVPVVDAAQQPKKAAVVADFVFQGRPGYIRRNADHVVIEWNGGSMTIKNGQIFQFTMGIPRKIHTQIRQAAGV